MSWSYSCGRLPCRKGQVALLELGVETEALQGMNPQIRADGVVERCNTFQSHVISLIAQHRYCFMCENVHYIQVRERSCSWL